MRLTSVIMMLANWNLARMREGRMDDEHTGVCFEEISTESATQGDFPFKKETFDRV